MAATSGKAWLAGGIAALDQPSSGQHSPAGGETITGNRNSGEMVVHRRRAPAPMRFAFAGAGERTTFPPPTSVGSPEDSIRIRAQLRPTFAYRRKTDTGKPNSGERTFTGEERAQT